MSTLRIPVLLFAITLASLGNVFAQALDISSGGTPTITGALNGSVTGSSGVTSNLAVTINFGELSPLNTNNIVKVVVPIGIRSNQPYQVSAAILWVPNLNTQAIQRSDIGLGFNNMHVMGPQARNCTQSPHIFYSPFNIDPASNVAINSAGRAAYSASLSNIGVSTVILSGPRLSQSSNPNRQGTDGWVFDAIFAITPQFYATGTISATITFTISAAPNVPC